MWTQLIMTSSIKTLLLALCIHSGHFCHEDSCGPGAECFKGLCRCKPGFFINQTVESVEPHLCSDIDECAETPGLCGKLAVCLNKPGTYYCSCSDGYYPSTGVIWTGETFCKNLKDVLDELEPSEGQTREMAFLSYVDKQMEETKGSFVPDAIIANCFSACMEVAGVGPYVSPPRVSSAGDGETGSIILDIAERFIARLLLQQQKQLKIDLVTPTFSLDLATFGPSDTKSRNFSLRADQIVMEINMERLAQNNNGFAAAAFLVLRGMESLLSHQYFESEHKTQFYSEVFTAFLPGMSNKILSEPVNFTIHHSKVVPESARVSCVYWEAGKKWSEKGCWVSHTDENHTVCSCSHLSTFALILQIAEVKEPQSQVGMGIIKQHLLGTDRKALNEAATSTD